jgi:hypothetical protein
VRDAEICYPVLDRGRRWLERHGAEGVCERLLVQPMPFQDVQPREGTGAAC